MTAIRADMHIHTYFSDGFYSPEEVASLAAQRGLDFAVITDHDNCLAYEKFADICSVSGLKTVRGVEVSAYDGCVKVHILGYGMDGEAFSPFTDYLYEGSIARARDVLEKLRLTGVKIPFDEVINQRFSPKSPVHAMHIARAAAKLGYASSPYDFYGEYMTYGKPAYSDVCRPSPEKAVAEIKRAGGVASLAHPGRINVDREGLLALITRLKCRGLDAIEAVYSTHTAAETEYFTGIAEKYRLLVTGGSDSHRADGRKSISSPLFYLPQKLCEKFIKV